MNSETLTPLNEAAWLMWLDYRKQIRHPLFPVSHKLAKRKLQRFGDKQMAVIEQSIENGWRGLFPLRQDDTFDPTAFNPEAPW